jgi:hypothetical protein
MLTNKKIVKIERLRTQRDLFATVRSSHLLWLEETNNPQIEGTHSEIISMIDQITEKYSELLDMCRNEIR